MPPSLQAALTPLIIMLLTALATKLKIDAKDFAGNIYAIAVALTALIVAVYGWIMNHLAITGKERAEGLVKGISTKTGPVAPITTILNDPASDAPPIVINSLPPASVLPSGTPQIPPSAPPPS